MVFFCVPVTEKHLTIRSLECSAAKRGLAGSDVIKMETSIFN